MARPAVSTVLKNAFTVFGNNLAICLFIALVAGGLGSVLVAWGGSEFAERSSFTGRNLLIVSQLFQIVLAILWGGVIGAWAAPAQIYLWVAHRKGRTANLYDAVNYGLNRWGRVLAAHFLALMLIQVGNIVVVVGVLFGLQFAFVDAIATLDNVETSPIKRSMRLTSNMRGTIFRTMLVFCLWWIPYQLIGVYLVQSSNTWLTFAAGVVDHSVLILIDLCMVQYYLAMFEKAPAEGVPATTPATSATGLPPLPGDGAGA